ncbi:thioesterase II family protein [Actinoplanes regularis]|uniref:Surfactin synthase thioesterase subunit n=1 Tax=Actinoplanes regularis TaxID=52697 RepID=A0A238ZX80_9ACTN|nr:oleoyl-ACP hydrolase [Actinoplanes regularis]SNR87975.1 Surfactin synthase thioesterase subunit [Actinoplanes regularis]
MTTPVDSGRWLRRLHDGAPSAVRLVCLPHAGGSASFFFPLSKALAPAVQVLAVQYPGRQDRHREPAVDDLHTMADRITDALVAEEPGPVALFGHSMGAVLAYEIGLRLAGAGLPAPLRIFASGRRAPSRYREERIHLRDDDGVIEEVRRLSGTKRDLLADPDLLRMFLPALRADYRAIETYRHRPGALLDCPITVLIGTEDPVVSGSEATTWREHTTGPVDVRTFSGGHFFLIDHAAEITALLATLPNSTSLPDLMEHH